MSTDEQQWQAILGADDSVIRALHAEPAAATADTGSASDYAAMEAQLAAHRDYIAQLEQAVEAYVHAEEPEQDYDELGQLQALAEQTYANAGPHEILAAQAATARDALRDTLGARPSEAAGAEEIAAEADQLVASTLGDVWSDDAFRAKVGEELTTNPAWLRSVEISADPGTLASGILRAAEAVQTRERQQADAAAMKRRVQTATGQSGRPQTLSPDEEVWAKIRAADGGGYNS